MVSCLAPCYAYLGKTAVSVYSCKGTMGLLKPVGPCSVIGSLFTPGCGCHHATLLPQAAAERLYNGTDASLARWHRGMAALFGWIEARTPVGEVADVIGAALCSPLLRPRVTPSCSDRLCLS